MREEFLQAVISRLRPLLGQAGQVGLDLAEKNLSYLRSMPEAPAHFAVLRATVQETVVAAIMTGILSATTEIDTGDRFLG